VEHADIKAFLEGAEVDAARAGTPGPAQRLADLATRHPDHARLTCYHADALHSQGRRTEAALAYQRAVRLDPTLFDAWYGLGAIHLAEAAYGHAVTALRQALAVRHDAAAVRCNLADALFNLGEVDAAVREYRRAAARGDAPVREAARRALALIIVGGPASDHAAILQARRDWLGDATGPAAPAPAPGRKLRVGYLSAFFGAANWMKPVWAVINRHDRAAMDIHLISDGADPSAESGYRDHAEDHVWRVRGVSNEALARHILQAGLDVLIDLNGYSAQERLKLFLLRPAPRILGWFNMYATTGTAAFDAIIGDAAVIPPEEERFYAEKVLRVPGTYLAFEVGYPVPDAAPPPCLLAGHVTFGCLGSGYKLTDAVLDAWAAIMAGAPAARLLVKNRLLDEASNREHMLHRLVARGIDPARVTLAGGAAHDAFLAAYAQVDIALDTFPYNGGTTTTEALWQGVPVLAFDGDRWAGRTSKSLLLAAGLADWVASDRDGYVATAIALARDPVTPDWLATLRATMRARLRASPACDTARLCRELERIYSSS
jgi:predicted O-linked N-acetylglucosamine transferase (SPINDLY family)